MAKDPVFGMAVHSSTAEWESDRIGTTYYSYASGCKQSFDENPSILLHGESH